jgi:CheY-like chemotaxis protein
VNGRRQRPLVLVVDDQPDNVAIVRMRLESQDHDVIEAGDGLSALEQIAAHVPDLVLLDIMRRCGACARIPRCRSFRLSC